MDPTALHWEQLPTVFAFVTMVLGATVGLLLVALPRREAWTWVGGDEAQHRQTLPPAQRLQPARHATPELLAHPAPG